MRHLASVRFRATAAAALLFAAALMVGTFGLVIVLRRTMTDNVDTALRLRATDVALLLEGGTQPATLAIAGEDDSFIQVSKDGEVIAASVNIEGQGLLSVARPDIVVTLDPNPISDSPFRMLLVAVDGPAGQLQVVVGNTLEDVNDTVRVTSVTLAVGVPLLLILVSTMTWTLIGRALRPVESIRAEVAEIGATDLHRRVPPPTTDDEIGRLADTMNHMLDRIESGTSLQRRFVSDASHELRTPIAIIRHELEVALRHEADADWPVVAADVLEEDIRMQRLVDDLLLLARHDQVGAARSESLIDLDEIAEHQAHRLRGTTAVSIDVSGVGAGQVRGSEDELNRVVQNLLDNAVRHARSEVALTVVGTEDGHVVLHVDDDGTGVPSELRSTVFERFTRGDDARARDDGGAGLGLAIAREIVVRHGGTLTVNDGPLGGARFTLRLVDARASLDSV